MQPIGSTDHVSFNKVGVLGFNAVQDYDLYDTRIHHTNMDTFERVKEADLKECAVVLAAFAYRRSNAYGQAAGGQASVGSSGAGD